MCLYVIRKKYEKNVVSLKSLGKGVGSGVASPDPDLLARGADPDPNQNVPRPQRCFCVKIMSVQSKLMKSLTRCCRYSGGPPPS
jgi:hypothetical protein